MMKAQRGRVTVYQGVAYFHPADAPGVLALVRDRFRVEFPGLRAVGYGRGVALQVRPSGDYLGPDLRPSMETALRRFSAA